MKLLVIMPAWIGDAVISQPLLRQLRRQYPSATIDAVAGAWIAPVAARMPEITHIIDSPLQHGRLNWRAMRTLSQALAEKQYDEAFILPNSFKSALIPWQAKIPVRRGFLGELRLFLLNQITWSDPKRTIRLVDRYLMLVDEKPYLNAAANDSFSPPKLTSSKAQQAQTLAALNLDPEKPIVALCPGAEYGPAKRWPIKHFASLARMLSSTDIQICLLGSKKDHALGEQIITDAVLSPSVCINLCGRTSLDQAIDLLAASVGAVTNDSGLMHIAAAVGTKVIAIYGSSDPNYTPPLSDSAVMMRNPQSCSPCFQRKCRFGHYHCLEIAPDRVFSQLIEPHIPPS